MESLISKLFFHQWQRKFVALLTAIVIWFFVNHSITSSKTIPSVPIRVINLPTDKTIQGLLPNGFLSKRITLTLSGAKDVVDQLEPGDIEIIIDVSNLPSDGIVQITKKNLVSLNPNINLTAHVTSISHPEFMIKMSPLLTEKIPITIHPPTGHAPKGFEFLDIWPIHLTQTVSGPQEEVLKLKNQGLEITFNLDDITNEQLDALQGNGLYDEVSFSVPDQWKKINIPLFSSRGPQMINDPEAKNLQITFLHQQLLPIKNEIPLHVFYPLKYSASINPDTYGLASSPFIQQQNHLPILTLPLYASNVSKLFLEIVKDSIEIDIVAAPPTEREFLEWDVNFIDETHLEDTYVAFLISNSKMTNSSVHKNRDRETYFRQRFRFYVQHFALYLSSQYKLELQCRLDNGKIRIHIPNASLVNQKLQISNAR
jgi:YbbR domain-containing protein